MGKFYLENKHIWFRHQMERSHKKHMLESGGFAAAAKIVDELRFFHRDGDAPVQKNLRISDHGLPQLAVLSANGFVGLLDDASTKVMRAFFAANPGCSDAFPATLVRHEEISGAYVIRPWTT